jgi:hypothetical protein
MLPRIAAAVSSRQASQIGVVMAPVAMNSPVMKSSESPGRKKPISSPHSAKMIRMTPARAKFPIAVSSVCGSR